MRKFDKTLFFSKILGTIILPKDNCELLKVSKHNTNVIFIKCKHLFVQLCFNQLIMFKYKKIFKGRYDMSKCLLVARCVMKDI